MKISKKDVKQEKPSKIKIEFAFDKCRDYIQEKLKAYQTTIDKYVTMMTSLKKEKRFTEAERYKEKLKLVLARQAKMNDLMDQIEQFSYLIDDAFAEIELGAALGTAFGEINKIDMSPQIKALLKQFNDFSGNFSKEMKKMDSIFGMVSSKISNIDSDKNASYGKEIDDIVAQRLAQYDRQTTADADDNNDPFNLN